MNMRRIAALGAMLGSAMLASAPARAAYILNIDQVGTDVVATGSGSLNLLERQVAGGIASGSIRPSNGTILLGSGNGQLWQYAGNYTGFGGGPYTAFGGGTAYIGASQTSGATVGLVAGMLVIPLNYLSGTELGTSTATFANTTLADLGATPGTYAWTWGSEGTADSFTINVGLAQSAVPEPATWAMMLLGMGAVGFAMRRRAQQPPQVRFDFA